MWNDTDIPLAYLITFRCYGTWLHGDERGSTDRRHNGYQSPYRESNKRLHDFSSGELKSEPVCLDAAKRELVESAVREVCDFRSWLLRAINVRTNHVHTVVSIGDASPSQALNNFKAYATRKCAKITAGNMNTALGRVAAVSGTYGMKEASNSPSLTLLTGKAASCRTLTERLTHRLTPTLLT